MGHSTLKKIKLCKPLVDSKLKMKKKVPYGGNQHLMKKKACSFLVKKNLPVLLTLGNTVNDTKSPSCLNTFFSSLTKAVNCSLCSSGLSSRILSPTKAFLIPCQKDPSLLRIFFGLVSGNSQAKSSPSNPKVLTKVCAELTKERRCSRDSICESTTY